MCVWLMLLSVFMIYGLGELFLLLVCLRACNTSFFTVTSIYEPKAVVHVHEMCSTCKSTNITCSGFQAVRCLCCDDLHR